MDAALACLSRKLHLGAAWCIYIYIYIYIHTHTLYIYIYTHIFNYLCIYLFIGSCTLVPPDRCGVGTTTTNNNSYNINTTTTTNNNNDNSNNNNNNKFNIHMRRWCPIASTARRMLVYLYVNKHEMLKTDRIHICIYSAYNRMSYYMHIYIYIYVFIYV